MQMNNSLQCQVNLKILHEILKALELKRAVCTEVWTIMGLCSLSDATISRGYTGCALSIRIRAVSMVMSTPVRPIPALKEANAHNYSLVITQSHNAENETCMQQVILRR